MSSFMTSDPVHLPSLPYRILVEDRLAFVAAHNTLDAVLADLGARLAEVPDSVSDTDLAIWRQDRLEAIVLCRPGRAFEVRRLTGPTMTPRRPRITIGALMLVILGCALLLAALRTRAGVELLKEIVMFALIVATAMSALATVYYTAAYLRDESP